MEGLRLLHARAARQRLLAPDDLAGRRPAGAPPLGELTYDLQAAAALVLAVGLAQSRQRPGGVEDFADQRLLVDEPELEPVLLNVPLQMLAYHVAAKLGRDIDKPRNLAKSVTVE